MIQTEIKWNLSTQRYICINYYSTAQAVANLFTEKQYFHKQEFKVLSLHQYKKKNKQDNF